MKPHEKPGTPGDILEHHGVKGMHWGIRRNLHPDGSKSGAKVLSEQEKRYNALASKIQSGLIQKGVDSNQLRAKYGMAVGQSLSVSDQHHLTELQKKALEAAGLGVLAVGVVAVSKEAGIPLTEIGKAALDVVPKTFETVQDLEKARVAIQAGARLGHVVDELWDTGVELPKGHIFSRVSTVAETKIRPGGFYAAFHPEDIERYKAVIPVYWKDWGMGSPNAGGFVNHYEALKSIKAPTGKEAVDIYAHLLKTNKTFRAYQGMEYASDKDIKGLIQDPKSLKQLLEIHSIRWADENDPGTKAFFAEAKKRGHNALVDYNDAGKLTKMPIRIIDSDAFKIAASDKLELPEMLQAAQNAVAALAHAVQELAIRGEAFLAHHFKKLKARKL